MKENKVSRNRSLSPQLNTCNWLG